MKTVQLVLLSLGAWAVGFGAGIGVILSMEANRTGISPEGAEPLIAAVSTAETISANIAEDAAPVSTQLVDESMGSKSTDRALEQTERPLPQPVLETPRPQHRPKPRRPELFVGAPDIPDIPLARSESVLVMLPSWRISNGIYSGTELERWLSTKEYIFVPNQTRVEMLEKNGDHAKVRTVASTDGESVTGWIYEMFVFEDVGRK